MLRTALKYAVRQGLVVRNPADMVTPPRAPQLEQRVLTPSQVAQLLDTLRPHRLYALIIPGGQHGDAPQELIHLRWGDVDLDALRLDVCVQRQYRPGEGVQEKETKEHRGVRAIELTEAEVAVLREHRKRQDLERRDLREAREDPRLVFASELVITLNPWNLQRFLDSALKKAGLPDVRSHDLCHTAGTLLMRHDGRVVAAPKCFAPRTLARCLQNTGKPPAG
jgi:integrase